MTMLKAITKGITIFTAASSLLAGLPRYDCLCAGTKSCSAPAGTHAVAIKTAAAPACRCCGRCGHKSGSGTSCCGMAPAVVAKADCCEEAAPESKKPASNDDQITGFGCHACSSRLEVAYLPPTPSANPEHDNSSLGWVLHLVPHELPTSNPCSPFRWKQYQLPPPPDLIITLQHYLI
jgi:hypothetical protein